MKPSSLFLASLLLCGVLAGQGMAHAAEPVSPSASWSADEAQIRAASQASAEAWNRGDLKGHLAIYVDDVTFMTRTGPRPGVDRIEESFAQKYFRDGQPKQTLSFQEITLRPLGPDAALGTGRFLLSGGGEAEQSGWFTLIWVRTPRGWKVIHDHSS
ncbi:MAG TPA: nuclear transport factor 2 family protein [Thermoanaerobaculia bacterium]|nr:nuclear transport factor 2 family protein [Thermoanaerobaculia bacterium]